MASRNKHINEGLLCAKTMFEAGECDVDQSEMVLLLRLKWEIQTNNFIR